MITLQGLSEKGRIRMLSSYRLWIVGRQQKWDTFRA